MFFRNTRFAMKIFAILCVYFCASVHGQFDFSNLGQQIQENVRRNLANIDNLNSRMYHQSLQFPDIGSIIQSRFADFDDLGTRIYDNVQNGLKPLNAMVERMQMINGIGGKTVAAYPNGKMLIAENGNLQECSGSVDNQGNCLGTLSPINFNKNEDYCFVQPNVRVNNYLCFSSNSQGVSASMINGKLTCSTVDNKPYLLISEEDYKKMCGALGGNPTYTYFRGANSPIPNDNSYVKCGGNRPNVCVFN